jgi:uncharacterized protein YegP (UPF0339 family)
MAVKKRKPTITLKKGKKQTHVVLKGANNRTIATTEPYSSKTEAKKAQVRLKKLVAKAKIKKY